MFLFQFLLQPFISSPKLTCFFRFYCNISCPNLTCFYRFNSNLTSRNLFVSILTLCFSFNCNISYPNLFRFDSDYEDEDEDKMAYLSIYSTGQTSLKINTENRWWTPELLQAVLLKQVTLWYG
jgi:hypothetical protein